MFEILRSSRSRILATVLAGSVSVAACSGGGDVNALNNCTRTTMPSSVVEVSTSRPFNGSNRVSLDESIRLNPKNLVKVANQIGGKATDLIQYTYETDVTNTAMYSWQHFVCTKAESPHTLVLNQDGLQLLNVVTGEVNAKLNVLDHQTAAQRLDLNP